MSTTNECFHKTSGGALKKNGVEKMSISHQKPFEKLCNASSGQVNRGETVQLSGAPALLQDSSENLKLGQKQERKWKGGIP